MSNGQKRVMHRSEAMTVWPLEGGLRPLPFPTPDNPQVGHQIIKDWTHSTARGPEAGTVTLHTPHQVRQVPLPHSEGI